MPDISGVGPVPEYLHRDANPIDRARACTLVDSLLQDASDPSSCLRCGGVGFLLKPADIDWAERRGPVARISVSTSRLGTRKAGARSGEAADPGDEREGNVTLPQGLLLGGLRRDRNDRYLR